MAMPPQLARWQCTKPRKYKSTKLIAEALPCFNVNELTRAIPHRHGTVRTQHFTSSSHPPILRLRLTCEDIQVTHENGNTQKFRLKWIKTGFGHRPTILCDKCQQPRQKLYNHYDDLACRRCRGAIYLSQKVTPKARPVLKAHRLEKYMLLKSNIQQRTRDRLLKRFGEKAMMPQGNYNTGTPRLWE